MTASQAFFSGGAVLKVYDANDANPISIAEFVDLPVNLQQDLLDATNHGSGGWKERKVGLKDGGVLQCDLHWLPGNAGHQLLKALFDDADPNKSPRKFEIVTPGTPAITIDFYAYVNSLGFPQKHDDIMRGQVSLGVTGPVTVVFG